MTGRTSRSNMLDIGTSIFSLADGMLVPVLEGIVNGAAYGQAMGFGVGCGLLMEKPRGLRFPGSVGGGPAPLPGGRVGR